MACRLLPGGDILVVVAAMAAVLVVPTHRWSHLAWLVLTAPVWTMVFWAYRLYDRFDRRIGHGASDDLRWIFHSMLLGCVLLWAYSRLAPIGPLHFSRILEFAAAASAGMLALRAAARRALHGSLFAERVLLVGGGATTRLLARKIQARRSYGVELVGLVTTGGGCVTPMLPVVADLDTLDLGRTVREQRVDRVVISPPDVGEAAMLELVAAASELPVKLSVVPRVLDVLGPSVEIEDVDGLAVVAICPLSLSRAARTAKRTMDVTGAVALLIVALPLMALIAIAVKIESPGPALFRQRRVGRGGRPFELLKFRTMLRGAEHMRLDLIRSSRDRHWLLLDWDPRVTRIGRLLRLWSLDELPQLWNVLKGEMSLVGPRPLVEVEDQEVPDWARRRLDVTPGLTGLWQVLGRTNIPFEEMVRLDCLYVTNWSLYQDIRILLRTVPVLISHKGAN